MAATQPPAEIEPWHGPPRGFAFRREVQPVLDRYCVGCHDGKPRRDGRDVPSLVDGEPAPMLKNGTRINHASRFSPSYYQLRRFVRTPTKESDMHLLPPWEFHADTTRLVQMLEKGHYQVRLDAEAWDRLITWIDLNAPYHGNWTDKRAILNRERYNMKNGPEAARDFLRTFQFAKSYAKWSALQKLGDTYWKLLDDELLAEACYRECMSDFGGGWPGLQARVNLGALLLSQKRHDAALQCLTGAPGAEGFWKDALLIGAAKVHIAAGHKPEAIAALKQALATAGLHASQRTECENLLAGLK